MNENIDKVIEERIEDRILWRNYLKWTLNHQNLNYIAKNEFYKDRPIIGFIMKIYFFPYNFVKYAKFLGQQLKLDMINKEISVLKNFQSDKSLDFKKINKGD